MRSVWFGSTRRFTPTPSLRPRSSRFCLSLCGYACWRFTWFSHAPTHLSLPTMVALLRSFLVFMRLVFCLHSFSRLSLVWFHFSLTSVWFRALWLRCVLSRLFTVAFLTAPAGLRYVPRTLATGSFPFVTTLPLWTSRLPFHHVHCTTVKDSCVHTTSHTPCGYYTAFPVCVVYPGFSPRSLHTARVTCTVLD